MSQVTVLVGAQWGDEGKGKWIDILAKNVTMVARYQGGNNAGHTLYIDGNKVVLHQIPSGIFQPSHVCALTAGVVINPTEMIQEIEKVRKLAEVNPKRLWLSARSHVISPWHILRDTKRESETSKPIGTTKRGIGPTYSDKAARTGLRLGDYIVKERRQQWISGLLEQHDSFKASWESQKELWQQFEAAASLLEPFVCDAESRLRKSIGEGQKVLMEGAQGALLDIDHGTYPYVTSSATSSGGAFASLGFDPRKIESVIGVGKAYLTRVGEGPFPTELHDDSGAFLAKQGNEFGATTGRPRRCGWLDTVALRYSQSVNGFDQMILNKLDVLSGLKELKLCTQYEHPTKGKIDEFPWDHDTLKDCKPVYETLPGWSEAIPQSGVFSDLPKAAQDYIKRVEELTGCNITFVGTGVGRQDFLSRG